MVEVVGVLRRVRRARERVSVGSMEEGERQHETGEAGINRHADGAAAHAVPHVVSHFVSRPMLSASVPLSASVSTCVCGYICL